MTNATTTEPPPRTRPRPRCELLRDFAQLEALAPQWQSLWRASPRREIFTSFAWSRASWLAFGRGRTLCTPAIFEGDRLVGLLPIAAEGRTLRFLGHPFADYNDFLYDGPNGPAALEMALTALQAAPMPWDRCLLENLADSSNLATWARALPPAWQSRSCLALRARSPALVLPDGDSGPLEAIFARKSVRRKLAKLRSSGVLTFRHLEGRDEIARHLPQLLRQDRVRRTLVGEPNGFDRDETPAFFEALAESLDPSAEFRFAALELDGRSIAYHLGFESDGKFIFYKPTFDIEAWALSPGDMLLLHLLDYIRGRDVREFDFSLGDEGYKSDYSNAVRDVFTLSLFRSGPLGRTLAAGLHARERLRGSPHLYGALRDAARHLTAWRQAARRSLHRRGVLGTLVDGASGAVRALLVDRREVLAFSKEAAPADLQDPDDRREWEIDLASGTLSDLAGLAIEHPGEISAEALHEARGRLKRGDRLALARHSGVVVHAAWIGVRDEVDASRLVGPDCRFTLPEPAAIIETLWADPASDRRLLKRVVAALAAEAIGEGRPLWVVCPGGDKTARCAIEAAGFRLRRRVGRLRAAGGVRRSWDRSL